jgi:hypothetical protein
VFGESDFAPLSCDWQLTYGCSEEPIFIS